MVIWKTDTGWVGRNTDWVALFGTDTLPLPFTPQATAADLQRAYPDDEVAQ
jgi:hypothetical protein